MIFAMSVGSEGKGSERYMVYIPFVLAPGRELGEIEGLVQFPFGKYTAKLEKLQNLYAISVGPFKNQDEARDYIPHVTSALLWLSLAYQLGISYPKQLSSPKIYDKPIFVTAESNFVDVVKAVGWDHVDGAYDADKTIIFPDHLKLTRWEMGQISVKQGLGIDNFINKISQAVGFPYLENINKAPRLKLAIELYGTFSFEASKSAQFISLITCLESLTPSMEITVFSKHYLNDAKEQLKNQRNSYDNESDEWNDLNNLFNRLSGLGRNSIGKSMKYYLSSVVKMHPKLGNPDDIENKIKKAYNLRSKLLHDGLSDTSNVDEYLSFLREFVPQLLTELYIDEATSLVVEF